MGKFQYTALQNELIKGVTPDELKEKYGINYYEHPNLPLIGFKYSQIDSPKTNEIVRWARGAVLEEGTWKLIAQPFRRFFNYGENMAEMDAFDWGNVYTNEKLDGSLIILSNYKDHWLVNTSGSFGLQTIDDFCGKTWRELFWDTAENLIINKLNPNWTYMFEICSPYNKIVRYYKFPQIYLLGVVDHSHYPYEFNQGYVDYIAKEINVNRPNVYKFNKLKQVELFLEQQETEDPTFEGVVILDKNGIRFKVKSKTYLSLHRMSGNGNIQNPKYLIPWVLTGEESELLTYFPEVKDQFYGVKEKIDKEWRILLTTWEDCRTIVEQKDFAIAVNKRTRFSGLLFNTRKERGNTESLEQRWRESGDLIYKILFKGR